MNEILNTNPLALIYLLAAAKMDDDINKNLVPAGLKDMAELSVNFGSLVFSKKGFSKMPGYEIVDLPPFIKNALIRILSTDRSQ